MLPNTWNQPRFRQDNDPNAHHFYPQDMHSNPAAMQMNVVLQQDAHSGMNAAHSGMGHAHPHLGNAHQSLQPHFHTVLRGPDQPQYKQPPEIPSEAKTPQGKAPMIPPEESALVKKKPSNNGVLVKLPRTLRKEAKVWSRLYAQRDENGKFKQGFLMPLSLQQVLRAVIKKKDDEIANLKQKLASYESTNTRSSKYRGVSRNGQTGWCAVARSAKKGRVYCGTFQTELEAAKAWDRKTIELTGDAAERRLNFPDDPEIQALLANARATKKIGSYSKYRGVEIIQHKYSPKTKKPAPTHTDSLNASPGRQTSTNKSFLIRVHSKTVASCKTELEAAYGYNEVAYVLGLHATNDVSWGDFVDQSQERERLAIQELRLIKKEETLNLKNSESRKAKDRKQKKQAAQKGKRKVQKSTPERMLAKDLNAELSSPHFINGGVTPKKRSPPASAASRKKKAKTKPLSSIHI